MIIVGVHTNWIQLVWAMMAAASLTLGIVHLVVWFKQRSQHANLTFFALASAVAVFSGFELAIVGAQTPAEHALWLRWAHVPIAAIVVLIVVFVRLYFGVGRLWLAWAAVGFRLLTVLLNFTTGVNVNFQEVTGSAALSLPGGACLLPDRHAQCVADRRPDRQPVAGRLRRRRLGHAVAS